VRQLLAERRNLQGLQVRVEPFQEHHLPLIATFWQRVFPRPQTSSFYRWLYVDSQPFGRVFLALSGEECLGLVHALRKPYLIGGTSVHCLESFDWHSLPGLRGSGVGIWVLRALMRQGERLITVGGSSDVLAALPALGWQKLATTRRFELPLSVASLQAGMRRRVRTTIPGERLALKAIASWYRPRRRGVLGQMVPVSIPSSEIHSLYSGETGYDFLQLPDPTLLRWMTAGYPGNGSFAFLYFTVAGSLRAWALTRVHETAEGREAAILEVYGAKPDLDLYTWIVSEAATWLSSARPVVIRARASCPVLQAALLANRFRAGAEDPVHTWPKGLPERLRVHVTMNHGDEPVRPYPDAESATRFLTV